MRNYVDNKLNIRELIVEMVMQITSGEEQSHILIRNVLNKHNYLEEYDKAFLKRVTEGTLERLISIDYFLNSYSTVKVNKMKPFIRSLMRMSVYQIIYMDKVPDSAACNEAVKLANKRGFRNLKGFVNGVLRNISRNKNSLEMPKRDDNLELALSVEYSMPEYLVKLLVKQYGKEQAEHILKGYFAERPVSVRMREIFSEEELAAVYKSFQDRNVICEKQEWLPYAYYLKNTGDLNSDVYFTRGYYTVQDISSMLVCEIASIKEGSLVLDVCSAPGGKAIHACDKLHGTGLVDARDVSDYKTSLILENKNRMQVENLSVKVWDARQFDKDAKQKYDTVLLDIPCSGLGVIGKKPEIKYRLDETSLAELDVLQKEIVDTVWDYVKPGGTLVYSTCTIRKNENEEMVSYITSQYPYESVSLDDVLCQNLRNEDTKKGYLTLLPSEKSDGFFIAKLVRKDN